MEHEHQTHEDRHVHEVEARQRFHGSSESEYERERDLLIENRIFACLSYVSVLFVVPMILRQENEEIAFHARQGFVLFCAEVAVWFVLTVLLNGFLSVIFQGGQFFLIRLLGAFAWLLFLAVSGWAIYHAARGERWHIPHLGRLVNRVRM